jgi:predicted transcriptional regulator
MVAKGTIGSGRTQPAKTAKKKATFNLNADLHRRLKVMAALRRREMVELVEEALEGYLRRLELKPGKK